MVVHFNRHLLDVKFFGLAWTYQNPNQSRDKRWFAKNKQGRLRLLTWLRFMPLLLSYWLMWYVGKRYQSTQNKRSNARSLSHIDMDSKYKVADTIYAVATPKLFGLSQMSGKQYLYFSNFTTIIVIDSAVETNSHSFSLKKALSTHVQAQKLNVNNKGILSCDSHPPLIAVPIKYLYFPLLDLQSLKEVDAQDLIQLFKNIDALAALDGTFDITIEQLLSDRVLINFQCVMGLSRSVALHTLYLIYRGKLTSDNYVTWINEQYPKAHINDYYLPKLLVTKIEILAKNT